MCTLNMNNIEGFTVVQRNRFSKCYQEDPCILMLLSILKVLKRSVDNLFRTFSCDTMIAPSPPNFHCLPYDQRIMRIDHKPHLLIANGGQAEFYFF
jgi:hypothetical protein